jgi:hypothetical protein
MMKMGTMQLEALKMKGSQGRGEGSQGISTVFLSVVQGGPRPLPEGQNDSRKL